MTLGLDPHLATVLYFLVLGSLSNLKLRKVSRQMEEEGKKKKSSLRWGILRDAFLSRSISSQPDISRKPKPGGFNLIPSNRRIINDDDVCVSYTLPLIGSPTLVLRQRVENAVNIKDFIICNEYDIDNTGLVGHWPSEEVLAYYCMAHSDMFRSKRVLELGAGYGLAGLVIAAATDASEVIISDGNPQVVDYIQRNIDANSQSFSETRVKSMILHWNNQDIFSDSSNLFDIIVASDCTFFKDFHEGLARTLKSLLKKSEDSEAIFFCPKRGNTLDTFLEKILEVGLRFCITENYDEKVWEHHQSFLNGDESWRNYETEHCYPLLIRITL